MGNFDWKRAVGAALWAAALGLMVAMGVAMGFAALVMAGTVPETSLGYGAMAAVFLGGAAASLVGIVKMPLSRLPAAACSGLAFWLGLMLMGLLLFGGLRGWAPVTGGLCLGGAVVVGLMRKKGSGKTKYKVPKLRF